MTADEAEILLALRGVTFAPGTSSKRLVRDLSAVAAGPNRDEYALTEKQRAAVLSIAIRFRRQLSPEVVATAKWLLQLQEAKA